MDTFTNGFADELVKTAKYPISRLFSSPHVGGAVGGAAGAIGAGPLAVPLGAMGALSSATGMQGGRARALKALLVRAGQGGKGLMKQERKRLAEATGMSIKDVDVALKRVGRKHINRTGDRARLERAATYKYNPLAALQRAIGARGFAGRAARGGKGLQASELELIEMLRKEKPGKLKKLLAGAATAGGLGAGVALSD